MGRLSGMVLVAVALMAMNPQPVGRTYLRSKEMRNGKSLRKVYRATAAGRKALVLARGKVSELFRELVEGK